MALRIDSLADLPANLREKAAAAILGNKSKGTLPKGQSKYRNVKTTVNGITFDSQKEAARYVVLLDAMKQGRIADLRLQQDFTLQEAYTTPGGRRIRAIRYKADFTYRLVDGYYPVPVDGDVAGAVQFLSELVAAGKTPILVVEDSKSRPTKTKEYQIKMKMMAEKGYIIREV